MTPAVCGNLFDILEAGSVQDPDSEAGVTLVPPAAAQCAGEFLSLSAWQDTQSCTARQDLRGAE